MAKSNSAPKITQEKIEDIAQHISDVGVSLRGLMALKDAHTLGSLDSEAFDAAIDTMLPQMYAKLNGALKQLPWTTVGSFSPEMLREMNVVS